MVFRMVDVNVSEDDIDVPEVWRKLYTNGFLFSSCKFF